MNSSFTLGDTLITAEIAREVAKFSADLYFQNEQKKIDYQKIQADENTAHNFNLISYEDVQSKENTAYNANVISYEGVKAGNKMAHNANITKRDAVVISQDSANRVFNQGAAESIMKSDIAHLELYQALSQITTEANRIKIVAKVEEGEKNVEYDKQDTIWDLEMYQYGSNVLASIAGAASTTTGQKPSTGQSVLGGAMSGAALGAKGGPWGAAVGGIIGGIAGLLGS
jgi:hypothetical protein